MPQSSFKNWLIRSLPGDVFAAIRGHLVCEDLHPKQTVIRSQQPVSHVWFPESGHISVLCKIHHSACIEVGMIGREGMTEFVTGHRSSLDYICQVQGRASRIDIAVLEGLGERYADLTDLLRRYCTYTIAHSAFACVAHGAFSIQARVARWLLMIDDRVGNGAIPVAHDFFAWILAVRRSGITDALKALREAGCIATSRGMVRIIDRKLLIEFAAGSYGPSEREYDRLLGQRNH